MTLKSNPETTRAWKERSRRRLVSRAPLHCRALKPGRLKSYRPAAKGTRKDLERILDNLTRKVLRQAEPVSFTSGKRGTEGDPLEVSHLFGRTLTPVTFDYHPEGNCHMMRRSENSAHNDDKSVYRDKYIERFGQEAYDDLERRAHSGRKLTWLELHEMIAEREAML